METRKLLSFWRSPPLNFGDRRPPARHARRSLYALLEAVNPQIVYGVLCNGDTSLQNEANDLFDALNKAGAIS